MPITVSPKASPSRLIDTFLRPACTATVTLTELQRERALIVNRLVTYINQLHPLIQTKLQQERARSRTAISRGELANLKESDYVLVVREEVFENEKLYLRWRGPCRVLNALNDYVFKIEDLRNGETEDLHVTRLKYYANDSLDKQVIISHVLASEIGMPLSRLMRIVDDNGNLSVHVRWKGLILPMILWNR